MTGMENVPDASAVVFAWMALSTRIITEVLLPNPEPVTVTAEPGGPAEGYNVILPAALASFT